MKRILLIDLVLVIGLIIVGVWLAPALGGSTSRLEYPVLGVGSAFPVWNSGDSPATRRVVMVLDIACQICNRDAPSYARFAELVRRKPGTRVVVVSPDPLKEVRSWLVSKGIEAHSVVRVRRPETLGVVGYPTVLIVDNSNSVTDIAVGSVSDDVWLQLAIRLEHVDAPHVALGFDVPEVPENEFRNASRVQVVDSRDRALYRKSHRPGAVNIPSDELSIRGPIELDKALPVALDCTVSESLSDCRVQGGVLARLGFGSVSIVVPSR